jgi:hypothetical protein
MFLGKLGWEYRIIQHDGYVAVHSVSLVDDEVTKVDPEELFKAQDKGSLINEVNFMINACAKTTLNPDCTDAEKTEEKTP